MKIIKNYNSKIYKKIICIILTLILILTSVPINVIAEEVKSSQTTQTDLDNLNNSSTQTSDDLSSTSNGTTAASTTATGTSNATGTSAANGTNTATGTSNGISGKINENSTSNENTNSNSANTTNKNTQTTELENITKYDEQTTTANSTSTLSLLSTNDLISVFSNVEQDENFKIALRWGGTSNTEYSWNAEKSESRVIKLTFYYQNEVTKKAYAPGDLVVTIPGIGKLNRASTIKATDIAADAYGATELKRDWSYTYDEQTDTYTFYNNHEIEEGATFNGSFEILWQFSSRNCINEFTKDVQATLTDGETTVTSQNLTLNFTSVRDTFYINKTARSITSADGLSKYVEEGKTVSNYAWVQYTFRYNVQTLNARALQTRYFIDTFPKGCVIAKDTNVIQNEDGTISYKIEENSVPENSYIERTVIVGYPEEYVNSTINNTVYLYGTYKDETEETLLAESTVQVELEKIHNQTVGIVPNKYMSPDYIYKDTIENDINFTATLYATATTNAENEGYTVAITDDLLEIYTPANEDKTKEAMYHTLTDNEYKFTSITVPGTNNFTNANGFTLATGDYTLKIYALYAKDVQTRSLEEYTLLYEGKWQTTSITQAIEEQAVAIRVEVSGLTESIRSFYISTRGTINIAENIQNLTYENPSYIINYDFTELKDKEGNSLIPEITMENYSQQRLYERDINIYQKGLLRSNDTIRIIERQNDPGYYYAYTTIEPFEIDQNIEYFTTKISHYTSVNNRNNEEITTVEVHGLTDNQELEELIETLQFKYSNLTFKNSLSEDVDIQEYLKQRATITQEQNEISIIFDFSDNPITSTNFTLGYDVDARLNYENYYNSTNPSYTAITYAYINNSELSPQSTEAHNQKTMAVGRASESILLALASHQQLIKMVKTLYSGEFIQEQAVSPMNTEYTYRLKLRNGYNTLVNTEIIDILEHAELTKVDETYPYETSEWYGTFKNVDTTYITNQGLIPQVYYATTISPNEDSWILMENESEGIWSTNNLQQVKAVKVAIEGEIAENSIIYADINMTSPNDINLVDKKTYNTYTINCDAIDLYTGMQSTYMQNMPSNVVDVRLVEKEYDVIITKTDEQTSNKLSGIEFGLYDTQGNKIRSILTNILGKTVISNLKEGTYILKEENVPDGYEKVEDYTLTIQNDICTINYLDYEDIQYENITFTSTGDYAWTQNEDGTWQSNNYNVNSTTTSMTSNEFTVTKEGSIVFDWSVSSQSINYDYVYYTITNTQTGETKGGTSTKIGGTSLGTVYDTLKYNTITQKLSEGTYTITFTYRKNGSTSTGLDRAFVKNVKLNTKTGVQKTKEQQSTLNNNKPTINLNIVNKRAKGSITIHKIDEYLNTNKTERPLSGAQFNLIDPTLEETNQIIAEGTTNSSGNLVFDNLEWGKTYIIQEKQSLTGYELAVQNTYLSASNKDKTVTIKNIRKKGKIILTKQDEIDGTKLADATYGLYANGTIYNAEGNVLYTQNTLITQAKTDENGQVTFENIPWGNYYLQEIRTVYGYELSQTKHTFTISQSNVSTTQTKTENEVRSKATLQITKKDDEENLIEGVEFKLYKEDGTEVRVKDEQTGNYIPYLTNDIGRLKIENLEWGNYYIQEYMPADGYELNETKYKFTIDRTVFENGNTVYKVINEETNEETGEIINHKKTGSVILTKYACDAEGNETTNILQGAIYELYLSNGELQGEYTSNEFGQISVNNLKWGGYYFQEKQAPEGYSISNKKISFVVNNKTANFTQELTAYNKLESGEIKINKTIQASSIYSAHGNSTFIFKIIGKNEQDEEKVTLYRAITFTEQDLKNMDEQGNITKQIVLSEIEPYKYEITEEKTYRYELSSIIPVTNAEVNEQNNTGIINLLQTSENKGEITFKNEKTSNSLLTDTGLITNTAQNEYYIVGISATPKEATYEARTELTMNDFEYTLLYSGGQEQKIELTEGVLLEGQETYTQRVAGTYTVNMQITYNKKTYDVQTQVEFIRTIRFLADEVEVGDYVAYDANLGLEEPETYTPDSNLTGYTGTSQRTFSSADTMKWRVLSVDREAGTVELMSADPTSNALYLTGRKGYINSVDVLNDVGAVYGHGQGATGGRSINLEDVEQYSSYDPTTYSNGYKKYGETRTYTSGNYFVDVQDGAITGGIPNTDEGYTECIKATTENPVTATQTSYYYQAQNYFENEIIYQILFRNASNTGYKNYYWLASRAVHLNNFNGCDFLVRDVGSGRVNYSSLAYSYISGGNPRNYRVVPVVSLESDIQTSGKDSSGAWVLKFN